MAGSANLPIEEFRQIVRNAPLISIDLIVDDGAGRYLLGLRTNAPAKGYWFVPGGRVYKNERLTDAVVRISSAELGASVSLDSVRFLGLYEHFYTDNALGEEGYGTHYVVAAFRLTMRSSEALPVEQHSAYRWLSPDAILNDAQVHRHTQDYFRDGVGIR